MYFIRTEFISRARQLACASLLLWPLSNAMADWLVEGVVTDGLTRQPQAGADIRVRDNDMLHALADDAGRFRIELPAAGSYVLLAASPDNRATASQEITVSADAPVTAVTLVLTAPLEFSAVTVKAERMPEQVSKSALGGDTIRQLAGSSGDPLNALQTLPGVVTVNGSSAPAVRGSGPGDNAYYVDGLRVVKLFHYGSLSVFNADLISDFNLLSSAFGPHYENVTGAVIDVSLRQPRTDRLGGKVDINLMGANGLIEGPVRPNQSFYFAARRSYIDMFIHQIEDKGVTLQIPQYWDYQGKYLWQPNADNKVTLHLSGASDTLKLNIASGSDAGQQQPSLAGDTSVSDSSNLQGVTLQSVLSDYADNTVVLERTSQRSESNVGAAGRLTFSQSNLLLGERLNLDRYAGHNISLGAEAIEAHVQIDADIQHAPCTQFDPDCDLSSSPRQQLTDDFRSHALSVSAQDRARMRDNLTLIAGVRHSYEDYLRRNYTEPRLGLEWNWNERTQFTAGWGRHNQMPTGEQIVRTFGNPALAHIRADHSVLGVSHTIDATWNWKLETYYKTFSNLVVSDPNVNYINAASGKAYGLEWLLRREANEKLSGWLVVNLAKSQRQNDLTGESFRYEYDEPVNITLVGAYKKDEDWSFSAKWNIHSGSPYTPILGTSGTYSDGRPIPVYAAVNSGTLPTYHRLDLRADRNMMLANWKMKAYFELNNVYQRKNVVGYSYDPTYTRADPVYAFVLPISFGMQVDF